MHCPYEGQICCSREEYIDICYAEQLQPGVFYPRSTSYEDADIRKEKTPRICNRKHFSVDKKKFATPEKIEEWDYLKKISSEIIQTDGVEVGLLTGANCMKALEPLKVIANNNGGPYAYQTRLGWCIVGPISNMVGKDSIGCHRIAVQDAITSKIAGHHFVIEKSMRDISLAEMFQKIHQNDVAEKEVISVNGLLENMGEISKDDKTFRKTVEE